MQADRMERAIYFVRGQRVMLSTHLAELYGVEVRVLVQAGQAQSGTVLQGLHVSIDSNRVRQLEITTCDFKLGRAPPRHRESDPLRPSAAVERRDWAGPVAGGRGDSPPCALATHVITQAAWSA